MRKTKKIKSCKSFEHGSVLVFALFLMMISLAIGISLMTTSTIQRKSTLTSTRSVNAFQVADSGVEYAFWKIRDYRWNTDPDRDLDDDNTDELEDIFPTCINGGSNATVNGGSYELFFYTTAASTTPINSCSGIAARLVRIKKIKSVGTYEGVKRSVEVDVDFSVL